MIYNLANPYKIELAHKRIDFLASKKKIAEIKEVDKKRTDFQNKFFHMLVGVLAKESGNTFDKEKETLKIEFGYYADFHGERHFISTATMSTKLLGIFISEVLELGYLMGYSMPDPDDYNLRKTKEGWCFPADEKEAV